MGEATTLLREFDFKEANVPAQLLVLKVEQAGIDQGMADAAERFLTIEPADDGICPGDIVRISYPDDTAEGGTRETQFSVGRHFFDAKLEDALSGMLRGQTAQLTVKGERKPVTVLSVKRRHIPELTDEAVARISIPGVETIAAYRQHLIDSAAQRKRMERERVLTNFVVKQVTAQSEFTPVDRTSQDYLFRYNRLLSWAKEAADQEESVTETDFLCRVLGLGKGTGAGEVMKALEQDCEREAKVLAIGRAHAARDNVIYTAEECEAEMKQFAQQQGIPYETVLKRQTPEAMLAQKYISYYNSEIMAYYEPQYTVTVE